MSLPSGLIFFLDFTKTNGRLGDAGDSSVYGGGRVGVQITGGVDLTGNGAESSLYSLNNGYSSPVSGGAWDVENQSEIVASGAFDANGEFNFFTSAGANDQITEAQAREILRYDPDIASGTIVQIHQIADVDAAKGLPQLNKDDLVTIALQTAEGVPVTPAGTNGGTRQLRRLSSYLASDEARTTVYLVTNHTGTANTTAASNDAAVDAKVKFLATVDYLQYATADNFATGLGNQDRDWETSILMF